MFCGVKMTPEQLMAIYPQLDFLMAQTLLKLNERGDLPAILATNPERVDVVDRTLVGSITVDQAVEK